MSPAVRAVSLDAAGTLIFPAAPVARTYATIARECGVEVDPGELGPRFTLALQRMPAMAFPGVRGAALASAERKWWREVVESVLGGAPRARVGECFERLFSHYSEPRAWRLAPRALATLEALATAGLRLALVSNFDSRLPAILAGLGVAEHLDVVVWSSAAGHAKPDPEIFAHAARALALPAHRVLHVGDRIDTDYRGALGAGMQALLVGDRGAAGDQVASIESIAALPDHLGVSD